tara:strand:- start:420 stop:650 length:231 start_codon:yes stop_codon:yes gene_type:complete
MNIICGKRKPPGDRWEIKDSDGVFESLTDALNQVYLKFGVTNFNVDAKEGTIQIDDGVEEPAPPPKIWDLYGEKDG